MVRALLDGALEGIPFAPDPVFGLQVPAAVPNVPTEILQPRSTWQDGAAYDAQASKLAAMFHKNIEKFGNVDPAILAAGPKF